MPAGRSSPPELFMATAAERTRTSCSAAGSSACPTTTRSWSPIGWCCWTHDPRPRHHGRRARRTGERCPDDWPRAAAPAGMMESRSTSSCGCCASPSRSTTSPIGSSFARLRSSYGLTASPTSRSWSPRPVAGRRRWPASTASVCSSFSAYRSARPVDLRRSGGSRETASEYGTVMSRDQWRLVVPVHLAESREQALADVIDGGAAYAIDYVVKTLGRPRPVDAPTATSSRSWSTPAVGS